MSFDSGMDIEESEKQLILIDFVRRDVSLNNFAENTVFHRRILTD